MRQSACLLASLSVLAACGDPGAGTSTAALNGVPPACPATIFGNITPPASSSDTTAYELGVKLATRGGATITGIRFYKAPQNTGTHLGRIWSANGDLLASATFTGESASGWQQAPIGPLSVAPGTVLVASVTFPNGGFSYEVGALNSRAGDPDGPVYALANGESGANGLYRAGPGFPTQTYAATSYFVDVVATDATAPSAPTGLAAPSPSASSVTLTWTAGADRGYAVHRHLVYRDGVSLAALAGAATGYADASVSAGATYTYSVRAEDFCGNLSPAASVQVTTPSAGGGGASETVFGSATPTGYASSDPSPLVVGVKLRSAVSGQITGVRFHRDAANPAGYTVSLWTTGGTRLAVATGAGGGPIPGWQEVSFASPVAIAAGTPYVASYHSSNGGFRYTPQGLASRVTSGNLTLLASGESGGNGVYAYGSAATYPASTYQEANYWVDVRFSAGSGSGGGGTPINIFGSAAPSNVTLSGDTAAVEVGVKLRASESGTIDAIRFYRQAGGSFEVKLWSAAGALLGSGSGAAGAVPGWQEIALSAPVNITAGATYVASYYSASGRFSYTLGGLASGATSGSLSALAGGASGGNGVYRYGGGFPAQSYQDSNYWVDVRFTPSSGGGGTPAGATIFGSATPSAVYSSDPAPVELGVKLRASQSGSVTGVRFYRQNGGGSYTVRLWSGAGALLGSGSGAGTASAGWQEIALASPVNITAGATYVATYHAPGGAFVHTPRGLASDITSGALTALGSAGSGGNGVYRHGAGGVFPTQSHDSSNYWVDVRFTAGGGGGGGASPSMSFFVTSTGNGANGGNFGGLAGADARCQSLAAAAGAGARTWRAYLSTSPIGGAGALVHARDRIGTGPWFNHAGAQVAANVGALHASGIPSSLMLTEQGSAVPSNDHDILTGTQADGTAWSTFPGNPSAPPPTCGNWTSSAGSAWGWVGHSDWSAPATIGNPVWNASHEASCSQTGLASTGGSGRLYCFALD